MAAFADQPSTWGWSTTNLPALRVIRDSASWWDAAPPAPRVEGPSMTPLELARAHLAGLPLEAGSESPRPAGALLTPVRAAWRTFREHRLRPGTRRLARA